MMPQTESLTRYKGKVAWGWGSGTPFSRGPVKVYRQVGAGFRHLLCSQFLVTSLDLSYTPLHWLLS